MKNPRLIRSFALLFLLLLDAVSVASFYFGVQNLLNAYQKDFDRGAERDSGYVYGPSLLRSWFVGAKVSF